MAEKKEQIEYENIVARESAQIRRAAEKWGGGLDKLAERSRRLDDFLAEPHGAHKYDIDRLLPHHGNVTIQAPRKSGKTTFMGNLLRSFADGEPFLGTYEIPAKSVVGVWDYEMNDDQLREWYADLHIVNTGNAYVLTLRGLHNSFKAPEFQDWAVQWLKDRGIDVWVLDPAHCAALGFKSNGDPNDAIIEFTVTLDQIKERAGVRNIAMPIHTGLAGDHARGGARWGDWPDAIWNLQCDKDTDIRTISATGRDVNLKETALCFDRTNRHLTTSDYVGGSWKPSKGDMLVQWLRENPGKHPSKRGVAEVLRISQENAAAAIEMAEMDGRITVVPGRNRSQCAWLAEEFKAHIEERNTADAQARREGHQTAIATPEDG
jgi:hypothetical protein